MFMEVHLVSIGDFDILLSTLGCSLETNFLFICLLMPEASVVLLTVGVRSREGQSRCLDGCRGHGSAWHLLLDLSRREG